MFPLAVISWILIRIPTDSLEIISPIEFRTTAWYLKACGTWANNITAEITARQPKVNFFRALFFK